MSDPMRCKAFVPTPKKIDYMDKTKRPCKSLGCELISASYNMYSDHIDATVRTPERVENLKISVQIVEGYPFDDPVEIKNMEVVYI